MTVVCLMTWPFLYFVIALSAAGALQNDYVYDESSGYSLIEPLK